MSRIEYQTEISNRIILNDGLLGSILNIRESKIRMLNWVSYSIFDGQKN